MWEQELKALERLDVLENNLVLEVGGIGEGSNVINLSELEAKFLCGEPRSMRLST